MSAVNEIVTLTIEIKDAAVSQAGFGVPMIAAYHEFWPERMRTFEEASELLVAPYNVPDDHVIYREARALKAQQPSPEVFMVGKRLGAASQTFALRIPTVDNLGVTSEGASHGLTIDGEAFTTASGAIETVRDALVTAINVKSGVTDVSAVPGILDSEITLEATVAGARHVLTGLTNVTVTESTVDPDIGIATDLAQLRGASDAWYGLVLDTSARAEVLAAAAWAETETVLLFVTLPAMLLDATEGGPITSALAPYQRTIPLVHHKADEQQAAAAWAGRMLPKPPGTANWANKSLAGVDVSPYDATERAEFKQYSYNYYVDVKGIGFTLNGRAGGGRFADITHGMDWFDIRTQERIVGLQANNDRIPYTDEGAELFRAQVMAQILEGITAGVIAGDEPWGVSVPLVKAQNPNDKIARYMPNIKFWFVLQGAVNKVGISGIVRP